MEDQVLDQEVTEEVSEELSEEISEELEQEVSDAALEESEEDELEEEEAQPPSKYTIKVNGKEQEVGIDELIKQAQLSAAAHEKFQKAAQIQKDMENVFQALQTNPLETLRKLNINFTDGLSIEQLSAMGLDVDSQVESYINKKLEELEKSPEQKQQEQIKRERDEYEQRLKAREEEIAKRDYEIQLNQARQEIESSIIDAMSSAKFVEATPLAIKRVAMAMELGYDAKKAVEIIDAEYRQEWETKIGKMTPEQIEAFLGKEKIDALRKQRLDKRKKPPVPTKTIKDTGSKPANKEKTEKKLSMSDYFRKL
jgi:hypothetical protein